MSSPSMDTPLVSIVIPVHNEATTIGECLESLLNQAYPKKEMIVVNDGSTDNTETVVEEYSAHLINISRHGRSYAKNIGIKEAKGEIIAFAEGDAIYDENYLQEAMKHFKDPLVGGVFGPHYVWNKTASLLTRCKEAERRAHFKRYKPFVAWIYRKEVFEKLGLFDVDLVRGEDVDMGVRMREAGYKMAYEPQAVWLHEEPEGLFLLLKRRFLEGKEMIPFFLKHRALPAHIYATIAFLFCIAGSLMAPRFTLAIFSAFFVAATVAEMWLRNFVLSQNHLYLFLYMMLDLVILKPTEAFGLVFGLFTPKGAPVASRGKMNEQVI